MDEIQEFVHAYAQTALLCKNAGVDGLEFHGVPVYLESSLAEVKDGNVIINTKDGLKELPADSVISSVGYVPGTVLAEKSGKRIHPIGDAVEVGNLKSVIWGANDLVLSFDN